MKLAYALIPSLFAFASIAAVSCSDSGQGTTTTTATASSSQSSSSTGTGGSGGMGGTGGMGEGGVGGYTPPPVPAACDSPMTKQMGFIAPAAGEHFVSPAIAWSGSEGAVTFAETTGMSGFDVKVQHLLESGVTKGSYYPIGHSISPMAPVVTIASDGKGFVVCFEGLGAPDKIGCTGITEAVALVGLSETGSHPSLAFGPGGYSLAFVNGTSIQTQRVGADGKAAGSSKEVAMGKNPHLASTPTGYILAYDGTSVQRLDGHLAATGAKADIATGNATVIGLSTSGEEAGVVWADGMQVSFVVVDASGKAGAKVKVDMMGAMPVYSQVATAGAKNSFASVWSAFEGYAGYRGVDGMGKPIGSVTQALSLGWDDNAVAVTGVGDGFLLAAAAGMASDQLKIAHLACP